MSSPVCFTVSRSTLAAPEHRRRRRKIVIDRCDAEAELVVGFASDVSQEPQYVVTMSAKANKQKHKSSQTPQATAGRPAFFFKSRLFLVLLALGAAGGTWAFFELVVWNKLPAELVGMWEVID